MPKLTADLIVVSPQLTNTLKDRELDLRGNKIGAIENLGATLDQFDTIDFSDNEIKVVDGFPHLKRLKTLIFNNNLLVKFAEGLEAQLPALEELVLTNNEITQLGDLKPLAGFPALRRLSLLQNPCVNLAHYRLFVIHLLPALTTLDFNKIKDQERLDSKALFSGSSGKKLMAEIVKSSSGPVAAATAAVVASSGVGSGPSAQEVQRIKTAIQNSTSLEEVRQLEAQLKSGNWSASAVGSQH